METHFLLLVHEESAYLFDLRYLAGTIADLECTNVRFYVFAVEGDMLGVIDQDETYFDLRERRNDVGGCGEVMTQGVECDCTIHGTGVHVGITCVFGECFGDRGFAARRIAVDSYDYFVHRINELISKVSPTW